MYYSTLCAGFFIVCISMYFGSVAGGGFNLQEGKEEVTKVLRFTYGLLGETNIDVSSIDNAGSLSELTSVADNYITQNELDSLKNMARNPDTANSMATEFFAYKTAFNKLLKQDRNTKDKEIPLTDDIALIALVWDSQKENYKEE